MYHVSQIWRPLTAVTVRFLKMSDSAMSIVAGCDGILKRTTFPPWRTISNASWIAFSAPDISKTTPIPTPSFCSTNQAATSSVSSTLTTASARAAERLEPERHVVGCEQTPGAERAGDRDRKEPDRPAAEDGNGPAGQPWVLVAKTAFPNGSWRHAISGGSFERSLRQTTDAGTAT